MKVLQLCLRSPYPPVDGGTIAMYNMSMALKKSGAEVKILAFNTKKHFVDPSKMPESFVHDFQPELVYLDATVKILPALISLVAGSSYNMSRFNTKLFRETLEQLLDREEFDIIQLESLYMTPYLETIRKKSKATVILRSHNVEFLIWQRLALSEKNIFRKWYLDILSKQLKKYETTISNQLDGIVALTEEDKKLYDQMNCKVPMVVLPIGVDTEKYKVHADDSQIKIVHLGSMDYLPNIEGVNWFLENIYTGLVIASPSVRIYLAGKNMPDEIFSMANDNLKVDGRIDDAKSYLLDKQVMIVPLLSGGGMRVKIIEGMAMGKTIISTAVGAEGIKYIHGKNILIADTPQEFINAIISCINNPEMAKAIGREARLLAETIYENKIIGTDMIKFYHSISDKKSSPVRQTV